MRRASAAEPRFAGGAEPDADEEGRTWRAGVEDVQDLGACGRSGTGNVASVDVGANEREQGVAVTASGVDAFVGGFGRCVYASLLVPGPVIAGGVIAFVGGRGHCVYALLVGAVSSVGSNVGRANEREHLSGA